MHDTDDALGAAGAGWHAAKRQAQQGAKNMKTEGEGGTKATASSSAQSAPCALSMFTATRWCPHVKDMPAVALAR